MRRPFRNQKGFTLIELSIVLVIIGLVVGGILVGGDLIRAAEVRSTISQLEEFKTAVTTFKLKFNCLPGDCDSAVALGLGTAAGPGDNGNGNGHLSSTVSAFGSEVPEIFQFWVHLGNSGLSAMPQTPYDPAMLNAPPMATMPTVTLHDSQIAVCYQCLAPTPADEYESQHYFVVARIGSDHGGLFQSNNLAPGEVFAVDNKIDDGVPNSGSIQAVYESNDAFSLVPFEAQLDNCLSVATTPYTYVLSVTDPVCSMAVRAHF
jgi:prepilin-type N-terminal cleavage/methylation domain-containing protein